MPRRPHAVPSAEPSSALLDAGRKALADAERAAYWLDRPERPAAGEPLTGDDHADLVVVGGGFTGLWAALLALEEHPDRSVLVLESGRVADGASGRNGGFVDASLTHGLANGEHHFPDHLPRLHALGRRNLDDLGATLGREGIDADWWPVGELSVAVAPHLVADLEEAFALHRRFGDDVALLDSAATRALVDSPTFHGGLRRRDGVAIVDPARLAWGLADAVRRRGGRIAEGTPGAGLRRDGAAVVVDVPGGRVRAGRALVATNAYPGPLRAVRRRVVPVYDHVIVTEPLPEATWAEIGWTERFGLADTTNQFHYSRPTADGRILWGGYDAVYHLGGRVDPRLDQRDATHELLAAQLLATFPQLEGVRVSHRWGGAIGTTSRFTLACGTAHDRRVAWVAGYTGLGVGASRFGARLGLDLLGDGRSELLDLPFVTSAPLPWPPEPVRWIGITLTRRALARADRRGGRRGPWLRLLDAAGVGFDT